MWKKAVVHGIFFLPPLILVLYHHFAYNLPALPPGGDAATHETQAAAFCAVAHAPIGWGEKICALWAWQSPYPPLMYGVTWLWSEATGVTGSAACVGSLAVFLTLLALGAYVIGDDCGGPAIGAVAVLLTAMPRALLMTEGAYYIDNALAAALVLSMAALLKCRYFTLRTPSRVAGACLGLALLSKFTAIWFLGPVVLLMLARVGWRQPRAVSLRFAALLGTIALLFMAVCQYTKSWKYAMLGTDSLLPQGAYAVIGCLVLLFAGGWWMAGRLLKADAARNALQAFCIAGLMAGPWTAINQPLLAVRWNAVSGEISNQLSLHRVSFFFDEISQPLILLGLVGGVLGLVLRRRFALEMVAATASGFFATVQVLAPAGRYDMPIVVLFTLLAVVPIRRNVVLGALFLIVAVELTVACMFTDALKRYSPSTHQIADALNAFTQPMSETRDTDTAEQNEAVAKWVLATLPARTQSLYVINDRNEHAPPDVANLVLAKTTWSGRPLETRAFNPNWEEANPDPHAVDRFRFLTLQAGVPVDNYPTIFDQTAPPPDAILLSPQSAMNARTMEEEFSQNYHATRFRGWTLLQK